jgi:hypothetical protein
MIRRVAPLLAIVAVVNAVMLGQAVMNRRGEPDAIVQLTERELWPPSDISDRDSSRALQIHYAQSVVFRDQWLDAAKLTALGFDVAALNGDGRANARRRAFVVLEYDGPAWRRYLAEPRRPREEPRGPRGEQGPRPPNRPPPADDPPENRSRLVAIDAAVDPAALRTAYPDRARYIIAPATVTAFSKSASFMLRSPLIQVPARWRETLDRLTPDDGRPRADRNRAPRYTVTLVYGAHHEPWIQSIAPIDTGGTPH